MKAPPTESPTPKRPLPRLRRPTGGLSNSPGDARLLVDADCMVKLNGVCAKILKPQAPGEKENNAHDW